MEQGFNIEEELKKLPAQPGVYIMHDARDEIIYVGKAISLKNRVRQYFQSSRNKTAKIEQMVSRIARFEYIITDSELEALVRDTIQETMAFGEIHSTKASCTIASHCGPNTLGILFETGG